MMLLTSLRPAVPNERLYVDDTVSRLFGRHFPSIKITPENAVNKRLSKRAVSASPKENVYIAKRGLFENNICLYILSLRTRFTHWIML